MAKITEMDREAAASYRRRGFKNIARYVEKYGEEGQDPGFTGPDEGWEKFYGKCLKEGHTWDYYHKYPKGVLF